MTGRVVFAAGLLVGSTTGAVLTAAGLRTDPASEPVEGLAPAQTIDSVPIEVDGIEGTCLLTYRDQRLTDITCTPEEPTP